MICEKFTDLFDLYAAGALEHADAEAVRLHLQTGCRDCSARLDEALFQSWLILQTVQLTEPPASLRERIAASVQASKPVTEMPAKRRAIYFAPWLVAAAAVVMLVAGLSFEEASRRRDVDAAQAEAQRTSAMLTILQAPGTKEVDFNVSEQNLPQGRLYIHKNLGVAMVVSHMPAAPTGWKYESWILPKSGAPQPVESFKTSNTGVAVTVVKGPVDVTQWAAMAVSMEPADSDLAKPTKILFASPV